MNIQQMQQLAAQQAAVSVNMNETTKGGGALLFPAGMYVGRIVEYVDLGNQPQEYQGKAKDPAPEFRLGVALYGVQGVAAGEPYIIRPFGLTLSQNEKSGAVKAFKALNYTGSTAITHFAQFLNEPYIFSVYEHESGTKKKSMQIDWSKTLPPLDPVSKQPYAVPQPADDLFKLFLWDFPTIESWNSLKIDGQTDAGKSKNFIQETILAATNFNGSALQELLIQAGQNYATANPVAPAVAVAVPQPVAAAQQDQVAVAPQPVAAPIPGVVQAVAPVAAPVAQGYVQPQQQNVVDPAVLAAYAAQQAALQQSAQLAAQQVAVPLAQPAAAPVIAAQPAPPQTAAQVPTIAGIPTFPSNVGIAPVGVPQ